MFRSLSTVFVLCWFLQAEATHIIGGEIFYEHLGGNEYLITLDLYRDCSPANTNNTGFDASVEIRAFSANGALFGSQVVSFSFEELVPVVIPNPCLAAPPNVCVATTRYQAIFNLPPSAGGYTISYQRCCRVPSILNLQQPGNQGLTCTVRVPGQPNAANDSPKYNEYPPIVICVGEELVFDHSASDGDGDSLVYTLCSPLIGADVGNPAAPSAPPPYQSVPWGPGYSAAYQLDSSPPMSIDPLTGALTLDPTQQGAYAVGVCVQEFRNGVLLGTSSRDFMFTAVICDANIDAVVSAQLPDQICLGLTQQFTNQSVNGQFWVWDFGDPATLADTSSQSDPSWTYASPGTYTVRLIANPGWPCADTSFAVYNVFLPITPTFVPPANACGTSELAFTATGNFSAAADVVWDFGPNGTPTTANGASATSVFAPTGPQTVEVTVSENGCSGAFTAQVGVFPDPVAEILPQSQFCTGLNVAFTNGSTGATGYHWDFGDPALVSDTSNAVSPTWTYAQPGVYTVSLIAVAEGPCTDTATTVFDVFVDLQPVFDRPAIRCPNEEAILVASGNFSPAADVLWDFGGVGAPLSATGPAVSVRILPVGVHPVTVSVSENGCSGTYTDSVVVFPFPVADLASESRACVGATFGFENLSQAWTSYSSLWEFGDGETSTDDHPAHRYAEPGLYTVTLTVATDSGCIATDSVVRTAQVEVFPNPVAAFSALPREVSVFDPDIEVEDYSVDAVSWTYVVEGDTFLVPGFSYSFEEGGLFVIELVVVSENGCPDSTTRTVFVSDHIFFAPNAFTPDGDGLNDTFAPVVIGTREYELVIYDRWGNERFRTDDPKAEWSGDGLAQGTFTYTARIKEWGSYSKEYTGHITLLR
jgi:gliding motility-associated-like protein